jgi:hypothetical protein
MGAAKNVFPQRAQRGRIVDSLHDWWTETRGQTYAPLETGGKVAFEEVPLPTPEPPPHGLAAR